MALSLYPLDASIRQHRGPNYTLLCEHFHPTAFDKKDVPLTEDECEQYHIVKKKMLGNIKFIGKFSFMVVHVNSLVSFIVVHIEFIGK